MVESEGESVCCKRLYNTLCGERECAVCKRLYHTLCGEREIW